MEVRRDEDGELNAYAWPGGYPVYYVTADSGVLCPTCAQQADHEGLIDDPSDAQWFIIGVDVNWEDPDLYCGHCSKRVPSAYADEQED